ncbi:MAG: insulinase family protein [Gemmatimonadetes bacterium]|nr:insulinase family protein [Gemmatimonadota bacterium]MBT6145553.1 insulinase family protein [Gemmatimonadota bacterium]MBT7863389.1 insulinase family protein [Gemmatimonadota bacterium]
MLAGASSDGEETSDFVTHSLDEGRLWLHVHRSHRYKSTTVDLFLPTQLRPQYATGLALVARLLERGTQAYPGIRELNQYTDWLYGAGFFASTQRLGACQALRLHFGAVDDRFLPQPEGLLSHGCRLISEALCRPFAPTGAFDQRWVQQEQLALRQGLGAITADRSAHAQRRCLQIMCPEEPYRLSADGQIDEIDLFDPDSLMNLLQDHRRQNAVHVYVCGDIEVDDALALCVDFSWEREAQPDPVLATETRSALGRQIVEHGDASQARLIIGHRGDTTIAGADYAAFLLLNLILGGDSYGRLYRRIREEAGLCYHIASYIEPMAGFLFVEAGIDAGQFDRVQQQIADELAALAETGPTPEELMNAQRLTLHRLEGIGDHRDALIHFHLQRRLGGATVERRELAQRLMDVDGAQVRSVAGRLHRDTTYLLAPTTPTPAMAAS